MSQSERELNPVLSGKHGLNKAVIIASMALIALLVASCGKDAVTPVVLSTTEPPATQSLPPTSATPALSPAPTTEPTPVALFNQNSTCDLESGAIAQPLSTGGSGPQSIQRLYGNGISTNPSVSADGRFVFYESGYGTEVLLLDRRTGLTEPISEYKDGDQGTGASYGPSISANGRFIVFISEASNLVLEDTNDQADAFVHDRCTGITEQLSLGGRVANAVISANGRFVALGEVEPREIFVQDLETKAMASIVVKATEGYVQGDPVSGNFAIRADGRLVTFGSHATDLVPSDANYVVRGVQENIWAGGDDIFIHDTSTGNTELVSLDSRGNQAWAGAATRVYSRVPAISGNGQFVAFESNARNLVPNDRNNTWDIFVRDLFTGITERLSVNSSGVEGDSRSVSPSINRDGRYVVFESDSSNLIDSDMNETTDVFVHDRVTGRTERVNERSPQEWTGFDILAPVISADGRFIVYQSSFDVFVAPNPLFQPSVKSEPVFDEVRDGTTPVVYLEAEEGITSGANNPSDTSGGGSVRIREGESLAFNFELPESSRYDIRIRYSNGEESQIWLPYSEVVGVQVDRADFSFLVAQVTGNWNVFKSDLLFGPIWLQSGIHKLVISVTGGDIHGVEIDVVTLIPIPPPDVPTSLSVVTSLQIDSSRRVDLVQEAADSASPGSLLMIRGEGLFPDNPIAIRGLEVPFIHVGNNQLGLIVPDIKPGPATITLLVYGIPTRIQFEVLPHQPTESPPGNMVREYLGDLESYLDNVESSTNRMRDICQPSDVCASSPPDPPELEGEGRARLFGQARETLDTLDDDTLQELDAMISASRILQLSSLMGKPSTVDVVGTCAAAGAKTKSLVSTGYIGLVLDQTIPGWPVVLGAALGAKTGYSGFGDIGSYANQAMALNKWFSKQARALSAITGCIQSIADVIGGR